MNQIRGKSSSLGIPAFLRACLSFFLHKQADVKFVSELEWVTHRIALHCAFENDPLWMTKRIKAIETKGNNK
jgi:hypothetical protein